MKVRVRLFALAREAAGCGSIEVDLPHGATVAHLRRQLGDQFPQLADLLARMMVAVNTQYAGDQTPIPRNADVACIPPVSGG
jgi:molybdopterin synthase sulfur carrier subunit